MRGWSMGLLALLTACGSRSALIPGLAESAGASGVPAGDAGGTSSGGVGGASAGGAAGASGGAGGTGTGGVAGSSGVGGTGTGGVAAGGTGGIVGGGAGGTGGGVAPPGSVGSTCASNADCPSPLVCWSTKGFGTGPAHGLCTYNCAGKPGVCDAVAPGSVCRGISGVASVCVEPCAPGGAGAFDPAKCHGRPDMSCYFFSEGFACVPGCNSDADCDPGTYCSPKSGLCDPMPPSGAPTGTPCTLNAGECAGICTFATPVPVCGDRCTIGALPSCGWQGPGSVAKALCVIDAGWSMTLTGTPAGTGDSGYCAKTCNCDTDCTPPDLHCVPLPDPALAAAAGKPGYCVGGIAAPPITCN